jgi:sulfite reductase (NADPH) flavoprotein alpha-component
MNAFVPVLPETAPFTPEQRAYLNGFFAGLFSSAPLPLSNNDPNPKSKVLPLTILFGSQTGTAEGLAKRIAKEVGKGGFAPTIFDLAQYPHENLQREKLLLLVTSTYGDGDPPDNAKSFWNFLSSDTSPRLEDLKFSVLALGDSNYSKFCQCGKVFDERFEALGAQRIHPRMDCDVDYEEPFQKWLSEVSAALSQCGDSRSFSLAEFSAITTQEGTPSKSAESARSKKVIYNRLNPYNAQLATNSLLNGPGSAKETRHFEIELGASGLSYECGDALGVFPTNSPALVDEIIAALGCDAEMSVPLPNGAPAPLRTALLSHYEVTRISQALLKMFAERTGDAVLKHLASPNANGELEKFLWGRDLIDLLVGFSNVKPSAIEFVSALKKIQPRLYSISSSPKLHPERVHLTVNVVRYESFGRNREGVCSSFLAERAQNNAAIPIFIYPNKNFRVPSDGTKPMIMIGPGTGIAPFRAFLQERRASGGCGKNWLFFGDQHEKTDFLYREELESMLHERLLTRLDTAFSRDQKEKLYVQHRMLENARELFAWLDSGAHLYVCGDAARMAKDVDAALHRVIETVGGRTAEQAIEYVERLKSEKRYQRDVY